MTYNEGAKPREPKPCRADGCSAPRKRYPSGQLGSFCAKHESERQVAKGRRLVPDEDGNLVPYNTLKNRRWMARLKADAAKAREQGS